MDIVPAAGGWTISQLLRRSFDGRRQPPFSVCFTACGAGFGQLHEGLDGAMPGSKILGCDVLTGDLPKITVHVTGFYAVNEAVLPQVLEDLGPGKLADFRDQLRDLFVAERNVL